MTMTYLEFPPLPELADDVQLIFSMESDSGDVHAREQIMPDGIVELVVHWGDPYYTRQASSRFVQPRCFAISMMRKAVEIESAGRTGFLAVRFYPWGAHHFFTRPIRSFLDQTVPAEQLWPEFVPGLMRDVDACAHTGQRVAVVQQFLVNRLNEHGRKPSEIDDAVKLIRHSAGQLSIEEICAQTALSMKQLERKFLASVGTTPKVFSRISRFLYLCRHLKESSAKTLTQLAHECGFYDQAHFIKEFKEFSGYTPREFFARSDVVFAEL